MNTEGNDFYKPGDQVTAVAEPPAKALAPTASAPSAPPPSDRGTITWTASEFVHHDRGIMWYGLLFLATVILAGGVYVLTKDYFATGTIAVVGVIVAVFAARKPSQVSYGLSSSGITVGEKTYNYSQFKSFSILRTEAGSSISLLPLKKFMPPVDASFGPADEEKITDVLGQYLPYEERKQAGIDRLSHKLRF
jgi:hypothetical protein